MGRSCGRPDTPALFTPFARELAAANPPMMRSPPTVPTIAIWIQFGFFRRGRMTGRPEGGSPCDGTGRGAYILRRQRRPNRHPSPEGSRGGLLGGGVDGAGAHRSLHAVLRLEQDASHRSGDVLTREILVRDLDGVV